MSSQRQGTLARGSKNAFKKKTTLFLTHYPRPRFGWPDCFVLSQVPITCSYLGLNCCPSFGCCRTLVRNMEMSPKMFTLASQKNFLHKTKSPSPGALGEQINRHGRNQCRWKDDCFFPGKGTLVHIFQKIRLFKTSNPKNPTFPNLVFLDFSNHEEKLRKPSTGSILLTLLGFQIKMVKFSQC